MYVQDFTLYDSHIPLLKIQSGLIFIDDNTVEKYRDKRKWASSVARPAHAPPSKH